MKHPPTKKIRRPLPEWLSVCLDIPSDLADGMRLDLRGRHTLTVHGCRRILHYGTDEIRLALPHCMLTISGERLVCTSYLAGAVGIEGQICGLVFCDEEGET